MATKSTETSLSERIPCAGCKKTYDRPLEIFDGSFICPHCGQRIGETKFKITKYNDDLTRVGQMYFGEYLSHAGLNVGLQGQEELPKKELDLRKALLANASEAFTEAAHLGHPEATVMLGYFCENGYIGHTSKLDAYRMAYIYYNSVCVSGSLEIAYEISGYTVADSSQKKFTDVKKMSAEYLLNMLTRTPPELDLVKYGEYSYSLKDTYRRLRELNLVDAGKKFSKISVSMANANVTAARRTLRSIKDDDRAPLFGYFALTPDELKELCAKEKNSPLSPFVRGAASKMGTIHYTFKVKSDFGGEEWRELRTITQLNPTIDAEGAEKVYFCFVNTKPKYNDIFYSYSNVYRKTAAVVKKMKGYLPEKKGAIHNKLVAKKAFQALIDAENERAERTFFMEDLFFASKLRKDEKDSQIIDTLIQAVSGG